MGCTARPVALTCAVTSTIPTLVTIARSFLSSALLLLIVSGCAEREPQTPRADSARAAVRTSVADEETIPLGTDMPFAAGAWDNPANRKTMGAIIVREYAKAATSLPRRITDSIARLRYPQQIMRATETAMVRWDSLTRRALAQKYELPVDTIAAIIDRENRVRTEKQQKNRE